MKGNLLRRLQNDIAELGSKDDEVAIEAEHRICRTADRLRRAGPQAIHLLVEAIDHPNPRVRLRAGYALAATRAPGTYKALAALTRDPDKDVRYDTIMALGTFGHTEAIPLLIELACQSEREDCLDSAAAMALNSMGRPALRSVLPLLQSGDARTRELAVWWLGRAGPRTMAGVSGGSTARQ